MKTVLLLRHAKSDWGQPGLDDIDRPLAKRGLKDAPRIGDLLINFDSVPDRILSSPAKRAKQTAELVAEACGYHKSIDWYPSFYHNGSEALIGALQGLPNRVERVMLVGHNPTMEETVASLLLGTEREWEELLSIKMPTAGLVCLDLDIVDWETLEPGEATLRWFVIPRLIKAVE